ncbi:MAG: bifunctional 4-hydroxy-2-oxoglutarate aldolase/2-dehydro-3-deoxy-phosphogluconate aldolase [Planctomycetota bacterium]
MGTIASRAALDWIGKVRCTAIIRTNLKEAVGPAMSAAVEGGFGVVEFTLNTPGALDQIEAFAARGGLLVGAGTVLTSADVRNARSAGASFIVSPVTDPEIIRLCRDEDLLVIPGTQTPTEMMAAHTAGAQMVKLFPCPEDGPAHIRACLGPLPFLKIFPTSGVTEENVEEFFAAGVFGVGFVNCLFQPDDLAHGRFDVIRDRAARMVAKVAAATSRPPPSLS